MKHIYACWYIVNEYDYCKTWQAKNKLLDGCILLQPLLFQESKFNDMIIVKLQKVTLPPSDTWSHLKWDLHTL